MNLTTQLRIILLLAGAAICLGIYLMGKRRATPASIEPVDHDEPLDPDAAAFAPADELDEDELETPAYMRRQGQREVHQDYEPPIAHVDDYADGDRHLVDIAVHDSRRAVVADNEFASAARAMEPVFSGSLSVEPAPADIMLGDEPTFEVRREPSVLLDDALDVSAPLHVTEPHLSEDFAASGSVHVTASPLEPEAVARPIPVMADPVATPDRALRLSTQPVEPHDAPATPTVSDVVRRPAQSDSPAPKPTADSSGNAAAKRKIIALRLPMPERVPGSQLLPLLQGERLQHGKFSIFHRLHDANSVFSVASIVEPGTFDLHAMAEQQFPGVTLFMLLPGPLDGLVAYDQMLSCAQRLAHATGGTLQDERGSKLTEQGMVRLRDEVLDFQHLIGGAVTAH